MPIQDMTPEQKRAWGIPDEELVNFLRPLPAEHTSAFQEEGRRSAGRHCGHRAERVGTGAAEAPGRTIGLSRRDRIGGG